MDGTFGKWEGEFGETERNQFFNERAQDCAFFIDKEESYSRLG